MAQWNKNEQAYRAQDTTNFEVVMLANQYGDVAGATETATARSAFGETVSVPITPVVQLDALYGLDPTKVETFTFGNGTAVAQNAHFEVTADATANSYGVIRSKRFVRYRPGQGCIARFTAAFTATNGVGPVGFTQRAGFFAQEQALQIGFDHTNGKFGILRANGGKAHIHNFTFSALADGDITVTANGTTFTAVTVADGSVEENVAALVAGLKLQPAFNALYTVENNGDDITILSTSLGAQAGAFTVTSTATVTYTDTTLQTGVAQTNNWIYQENFNVDKLDGTGISGVDLDHTKLNVYQINFRWLGAGEMRFAVENPTNGDMIFFHHIHYTNQNTVPHLDNPSMKIGYVAANLGGGTGSVTVTGASILGAIEGVVQTTSFPTAVRGARGDTMTANGIYHVLSLKNRLVYRNKINTRDLILKTISAGVTATASAPATVYLYFQPTMASNLLWTETGEYNASYYADDAFTITSPPQPIAAFQFGSGSALNIDVSNLDIRIPPNGYVTVGISSVSNMTSASAALTFIED